MLLGSGRVSVESTQTAVDSTVILTTNIEEMELLDHQLTSSKLLDRIEKVPVNYLLDASSETDILRRDLANMREKYDVDPNLLRIASYYSVMKSFCSGVMSK
jgi:predicted Ser/Thr protein kinase